MMPDGHSTRVLPGGRTGAFFFIAILCTPFLFGLTLHVFPIDVTNAALAVLGVLILSAILGTIRSVRPIVVMMTGPVLAMTIVLLPFSIGWVSRDFSAVATRAIYSYKDAKANPQAFSNWWNLFVSEVVRTNAIVFTRDPTGSPSQGQYPRLPVPGASTDFYKGRIVINNRGYRGDDISDVKGDTFRILTIGDSATFGQTLLPGSRPWTAVLQDLIRERTSCARPIQVINGGVNGYRVQNAIDRIEKDFSWLKPDWVISYFGWNTLIDMTITSQLAQSSARPAGEDRGTLVAWHLGNAAVAFVNKSTAFALRLLNGDADAALEPLLDQGRRGSLYAQYLGLIEQSRRLDYSLIFASFNSAIAPDAPEDAIRFYEGAWPEVRTNIKKISIQNILLAEMASQSGSASYVDTGMGLYGRYDSDLFLDVVHFTPRGDVVMAENLFKSLLPKLIRDERLLCRQR